MSPKPKAAKQPIIWRYKQIVASQTNRTRQQRQQARVQAVLENLNANLQRFKKPADSFGPEDMRELRGKVSPKIVSRWRLGLARKMRKRFSRISSRVKFSLIRKAFGAKGEKLGIVMVKPEMFAFANQIRKYLRNLGFEVLLAKNIVFDSRTLQLVYGKEFRAYPEFPIQTANLLSSPSKVFVFRQKPTTELLRVAPFLEYLRQSDAKAYEALLVELKNAVPPTVFDKLFKGAWQKPQHGTIRKEVAYPKLEEMGVQSMSGLARLLDPFGYFRQRIRQGAQTIPEVAYYQLTAIHIPSTVEELFNDADAFLSKKELESLKK